MDKIAVQPQAKWIGSWLSDPAYEVSKTISAARQQGNRAVFVAYNITNLNCGSGGATASDYRTWTSKFAAAIGSEKAVVILEPDALAAMGCLSVAGQQERLALLNYAVDAFKAVGAVVYLDAGHPHWQTSALMAQRLGRRDRESRRVLAQREQLRVDQHEPELRLGHLLRTGGKHFVVDTSRNGQGPTADYQWCNPDGRALGPAPTTITGHALADAYLWVKPPGESDGTCNGGPRAGTWWADYALGLAERAVALAAFGVAPHSTAGL